MLSHWAADKTDEPWALLGQEPGIRQPCRIFTNMSSAAAVKSQQHLVGGLGNFTVIHVTVMWETSEKCPPDLENNSSVFIKCLLGTTMQYKYGTVPTVLMILTRSCVLEAASSLLSSDSVIEMCAVCTGYLNFIPHPSPISHPHHPWRAPVVHSFCPQCFQHSTLTIRFLLLHFYDLCAVSRNAVWPLRAGMEDIPLSQGWKCKGPWRRNQSEVSGSQS